jgi:hypothetical protein
VPGPPQQQQQAGAGSAAALAAAGAGAVASVATQVPAQPPITEKPCMHCGQTKPAEAFRRLNTGDGFQNRCKVGARCMLFAAWGAWAHAQVSKQATRGLGDWLSA